VRENTESLIPTARLRFNLIQTAQFTLLILLGCNHLLNRNGRGVTVVLTEISTGLLTKPFCKVAEFQEKKVAENK